MSADGTAFSALEDAVSALVAEKHGPGCVLGLLSSSRRASPRRMARTGARGCARDRGRRWRVADSSSARATCTHDR